MVALGLLTAMTVSASAETWIAICNDGQRLQYNQTRDGNGFLYLKSSETRGSGGIQMARLTQTFYNGIAICGTVVGNGIGNTGEPITQLCANKDRGLIYIKYKHPYEPLPIEGKDFCTATVTVR